jgi:C1A family cysteine protease
MAVVDWRNRFNANWITSVRNQGATVNCWAFAMAAMYESMVRIEHGVWSRRSESDLGRATGKQGWDFGNPGEASIAAERFGVADPDCLAWSEAAIL